MSLFVCDKCGCIENTSLGFYWAKDIGHEFGQMWEDPSLKGLALCSECAPSTYSDGNKTNYGKWHGKFPKVQWNGNREVINRKRK